MPEKKAWEAAMGNASNLPGDSDQLLADKVSERKRKQIARQEEEDDATHGAKMAELAKKTVTSQVAAEKTEDGGGSGGNSGFTIKGGIDMGHINYPEMMQKQIEERDNLRVQAEQSASNQQQISEDLRERLHLSEIRVLETGFNAQMSLMTKMIESNSSQGNFSDQLAAARAMAKELGFSTGGGSGPSSDLNLQIELKRMDYEQANAIRAATRADKKEQREWDLRMVEINDNRANSAALLEVARERNEMFAQAPKVIGNMIGAAITGGGGDIAAPAPIAAKKSAEKYELTVPEGQGGSTQCPGCNTEVGVAPTAHTAVCSNCKTQISIKRVSGGGGPAPIRGAEPASLPGGEEEDN